MNKKKSPYVAVVSVLKVIHERQKGIDAKIIKEIVFFDDYSFRGYLFA